MAPFVNRMYHVAMSIACSVLALLVKHPGHAATCIVRNASSAVAWLLSGLGERALQLMTERALARTAFRKLIAEQGAFRKQLAECRIELDTAR